MFYLVTLFAITLITIERPASAADQYRRRDIADARYRTDELGQLLRKSYAIAETIGQTVKGQTPALLFLQTQVTRYLESFGTRRGGPPAINLAGLPGIGKSAIIEGLRHMGFPIVHFDAQTYAAGGDGKFNNNVAGALRPHLRAKTPVILVIEEIDKVAENTRREAVSSQIIGGINQILSSGLLTIDGVVVDLSQIMVITDMNIPPEYIDAFSEDVLKEKKSFFDYTNEDIHRLDQWLRGEPSAAYKILSKVFRNNTVGRLAPITHLMSPLFEETYRAIARQQVETAIGTITGLAKNSKRLRVDFDESLITFLARRTSFAPSGARETVARASLLAEQLINFAVKAKDPRGGPVDRPRHITLAADLSSEQARVQIETLRQRGRRLDPSPPHEYVLAFDPVSRLFDVPAAAMILDRPASSGKLEANQRRVTRAEIFATRYPTNEVRVDGLSEFLNARVQGQATTVELLDKDTRRFLARRPGARGKPIYRVLAGFPGIGKSEMIVRLAEFLKLPLIKINMQHYAGTKESAGRFVNDVRRQIQDGRGHSARYIVLFEEIDKVYELNPKSGDLHDRPVLGALKDLLNDGRVSVVEGYSTEEVDISDQLTFLTMNFTIDRFGFKADPRLTSIDDVFRAYQQINMTLMAQKSMLGSIFLPDTVSRLLPRTTIVPPLREDSYRHIIEQQVELVNRDRFHDDAGRNVGFVEIELRPSYVEYLYNDTVVPSEGARNTAVIARSLIETHVENALQNIPRGSPLARHPVRLEMEFDPQGSRVIVNAQSTQASSRIQSKLVLDQPVSLAFPSLKNFGRLPLRRIWVTAHEIGHALSRVLLGLRFDHIVVVSPDPHTYGYVSYPAAGMSAPEIVSEIYSALAGRVMERMVLSDDPMHDRSLLTITAGSSSDLTKATYALYTLIYRLGLDPDGGSGNRGFEIHGTKYGSFQDMPAALAESLGNVLRGMENQILGDLLAAHDLTWYVDKISRLAHEGKMDEVQFYELIDYPYPGPNRFGEDQMERRASFHSNLRLQSLFGDHIELPIVQEDLARDGRRGAMSPVEYWQVVMRRFEALIKVHLHAGLNETESSAECGKLLIAGSAPGEGEASVHVKKTQE